MKRHILLIDDDKDEMIILSEALKYAGSGHKCTWAQGVDHALKMLNYLKPDMIFIDMNMPVKDGIEGIARIRAVHGLKAVPVVLYSNHIEYAAGMAIEAGADFCIQKPSSLEGLSVVVRELFEHVDHSVKRLYELP
ncbi:response regulator [Sediminibacterium soli]|uniref:response regulator n=1 Tax=Sediminibacterium soli TaxID=2698829 RepID=UPI00137AEBD7|nr:response regulator [Sediminibacterium soli]NCI46753.1 response regulator [Sediminibacterium soli]